MSSGLAVLGAIAASYSLAKDIVIFCKRVHDTKIEIPAILIRFENDANLLENINNFLTDSVIETLGDENLEHLQRVFSYLVPVLQSVKKRLSTYEHHTFWDRARWAIVGSDLKAAEKNIYSWIDRLQKCLVLFPNAVKRQMLLSIGASPLMGGALAQQRMEEVIAEFKEIGRQQSRKVGANLRLADSACESLQPSSAGQIVSIEEKPYMVEWKRIPASDASDDEVQKEAEEEIIKLVSVLSAVKPTSMYTMRAIKYIKTRTPPTVPFGIVYELPPRFAPPVRLKELLEQTDARGNRILKHSLDQRFELVRQIASAILFIHSVGWVHKGIQTPNIWLAPKQDSLSAGHKFPEYLGTAFLAGFDYTRREQAKTTGDEAADGGWQKAIYQHPERSQQLSTGQPPAPFLPEHDIYGLGVVLVEIGRWKPLASYRDLFMNAEPLQRKERLEGLAETLTVSMGKRYVDVAMRCLRVLDGEGRRGGREGGPVIRPILYDLEDLAAAMG